MHFTENELKGAVSVWDTTLDMWVTGVWPWRFAERIIDMWERNGRDVSRYQLRSRTLDQPDNTAVLIVGEDDIIVAYFHWENRGYAHMFTDDTYRFVKFTPEEQHDITDIYNRLEGIPWNGQGRIITREQILV